MSETEFVKEIEALTKVSAPIIAAAIIFGICLGISILWRAVLYPIIRKMLKHTKHEWDTTILVAFGKPITLFFIFLGVWLGVAALPFAQPFFASGWAAKIMRCAIMVFIAWALIRAKDVIGMMLEGAQKSISITASKSLNKFITRIYVAIVLVFAVGTAFTEFGFNVSGLFAGLGIGSLTLSLAAKDLASNFFSGLVIILERPFETGDWITTTSGIEGTVEDVAFRTTKVRTLSNSLIIVPNNILTENAVTNWTRLEMRQGMFSLGLQYNTPKTVIENVCKDVQEMLLTHEDVRADTVQVRLDKFNDSSIDILVIFYTQTADMKEFRGIKENINLKIMDIMAKNKAEFAFPSRSIYIESMPQT